MGRRAKMAKKFREKLEELENKISLLNSNQNQTIQEKDQTISDQNQTIQEKDQEISKRDQTISEQEKTIEFVVKQALSPVTNFEEGKETESFAHCDFAELVDNSNKIVVIVKDDFIQNIKSQNMRDSLKQEIIQNMYNFCKEEHSTFLNNGEKEGMLTVLARYDNDNDMSLIQMKDQHEVEYCQNVLGQSSTCLQDIDYSG